LVTTAINRLDILLRFERRRFRRQFAQEGLCEASLRPPVESLLQIVKMGLDKQAVKPEYLASAFVGEGWTNPFTEHADNLVTGGLREAFEAWSVRFSPQQKIYFKARLPGILGEKQREQIKIAEAESGDPPVFCAES